MFFHYWSIFSLLNNERITLRGLEESDVDIISEFWNKEEFLAFSGRIRALSKTEIMNWIRRSWNLRQQRKVYIFGITVNEEKLLVGTCQIKILNTVSSRADLSIGIFNPVYRDKGIGTAAITLLIDYSFNVLNLNSLELKVFENNTRAISCYKKVGFRPIGVRRKADFINGEFINDLMMDLLKEEWISNK
jgi:RimJ/RimL family protein N-acetyltransferase